MQNKNSGKILISQVVCNLGFKKVKKKKKKALPYVIWMYITVYLCYLEEYYSFDHSATTNFWLMQISTTSDRDRVRLLHR